MFRKIICSTPGKIILAGEHAVVYGSPSVVGTIGLKMEMTLNLADRQDFDLFLPDINLHIKSMTIRDFLAQTKVSFPLFNKVIELIYPYNDKGGKKEMSAEFERKFSLEARSTIPASAGLGSSAATCACLVNILNAYFNTPVDRETLLNLSMGAERLFHSNPSGIDTTAVIMGGAFLFKGGHILDTITGELDIGGDLIVANTGIPRSTAMMVERVRRWRNGNMALADQTFTKINEITLDLWNSMKAERIGIQKLGQIFSQNQACLVDMGVSTPEIDNVIGTCLDHGATGCKLTGAGGGGCVLVASPNSNTEQIMKALKTTNIDAFLTGLGSAGLTTRLME